MKSVATVLIVIGVLNFLVGYLFKIMHWPQDMFRGIISGPVFIGVGLLILVIVYFRDRKK